MHQNNRTLTQHLQHCIDTCSACAQLCDRCADDMIGIENRQLTIRRADLSCLCRHV